MLYEGFFPHSEGKFMHFKIGSIITLNKEHFHPYYNKIFLNLETENLEVC